MRHVVILLLGFLLIGCNLVGDNGKSRNVIWENNPASFKTENWTVKDLSFEMSDTAIRVRETGYGTEGSMSCNIKYVPDAKFIQIKAGVAESAENTFYLAKGNQQYRIFTGWNTFRINESEIKDGFLKVEIVLKGVSGKTPGGWADIEKIRVVEKPFDGLTATLDGNGNAARVGSDFDLHYYPSASIMEKEIHPDFFVVPEMSDYRFCKKEPVFEMSGDNTYSCHIKIDEDAYTFKLGKTHAVLVSVFSGNSFSYTYVDFDIDISTKNELPQSVCKGANPDIVKYRKMWAEYTKGSNLALGKKVIFSKQPDFVLTRKEGTDATDLTDGKLSNRKCDTIWFDQAAVGWYTAGAENGVNCLIDLGKIESVGNVVVRALAGKAQSSLLSPAEFKVFVSRNGKDFYETASMVKLMQAEKELCNFKTHYYIDELGKAYVFPFNLEVNADARYIGIYIRGATGAVFCDEIAVMAGNATLPGFDETYKGTAQKFITTGVVIAPRLKELAISTNIYTPNAFHIADMRSEENSSKPLFIVVDVPDGISIIHPVANAKSIEIDGEKYTRWTLPAKKAPEPNKSQLEMIFFSATKTVNPGLPAYVYAACENLVTEKSKVPIRFVEIPEVMPQLKRFHVSLHWMSEKDQSDYSGYFNALRVMGFNAVPCFPRYWQAASNDKKQKMLDFIDVARTEGFEIIMCESPFHVMEKGHKEGDEIYSQLISGKKSKNLCPSYRGDFYWKEMARIAEGVALTKPDYVFWDIECWYYGAKEAPVCIRCLEAQKKSGKTMDEFLKDCGTENMKNLKNAVQKGMAGGKMPVILCYDTHPTAPNYDGISDFNRFYPQYTDRSANSFYVVGNALKIHDEMRENYKILKSNNCIAWLTAGCYGEYEPYKLEQMILEALLNGACGITYFWYGDFDTPREFYYHSKALREIAPYEDLIMDGEVLTDLVGSNKSLTYSAVKKGNEMLLLVGNYKRSADVQTAIRLPFSKVLEIKDLRNGGKKLNAENILNTDIAKDQIGLFYIKGR